MAFKKGEHYRCPDPECGCEIEVTKGSCSWKRGRSEPALLLRERDEARLMPACVQLGFAAGVALVAAPGRGADATA